MYLRKVFKVGGSACLAIPKRIAEGCKFSPGVVVEILLVEDDTFTVQISKHEKTGNRYRAK